MHSFWRAPVVCCLPPPKYLFLADKVEKRINMYFTYVLLCSNLNSNKLVFYTGYCEVLESRLEDHITHSVKTTKKFDKVELVYYEACLNKTDARKRELQLKTGFGRGYVKKRIENYLEQTRG